MASTFFGLTIAGSGLTTYNAAINTTANNVANVRTEGYTRQEVEQRAAEALHANTKFGMIGSGTEATGIKQIRDEYYDTKYWSNNSRYGEFDTKLTYLQQIENAFQDDDSITGFNTIFDKMNAALEDLASNPSDQSFRNNFINWAQSLCEYFNQTYNTLANIQKDCNSVIYAKVEEVNTIANEISLLNRQINTIEVGGNGKANELRDQRAMLVDKLSAMLPIEVSEQEVINSKNPDYRTGATSYRITVMGHTLVDNYAYNQLECIPRDYSTCQTDPEGLFDVRWGNDESILNLGSGAMTGEIKALYDVRDGNNLKNFAGTVRSVVNDACTVDDPPQTPPRQVGFVTVQNPNQSSIEELSLGETGSIKLENKYFHYTKFQQNADGSFTFELDEEVANAAVFTDAVATVGQSINFKGVPYYMQQMNAFIRSYAMKFNEIHQGLVDSTGVQTGGQDSYGNLAGLFFTGKDMSPTAIGLKEYDFPRDPDTKEYTKLPSSDNDTYYKLTAANFKVREDLFKEPNLMSTSSDHNKGDDYRDILDDIRKLYAKTDVYKGATASKFLETMLSDIAIDTNKQKTFTDNYSNIIDSIKTQRLSISGVDEDEEAMNLVKFQNAYNLSSRMVQCMSEIYNRLILETGV